MTLVRPPIQLLTAFEAAARLGAFKRAADELHVTPSALSQAIRKLEQGLGRPLFHRQTRRVELTDAGSAFRQVAEEVLRAYESGFERFSRVFERPVVRLSVVGFIAYEVVLPALHEFHREHPDIEVRIETSERVVDLRTEPIDAAIRLGDGRWPDTRVWPLDVVEATLVCSPALAKKRPIRTLADMKHHTLIVARRTHDDWKRAAATIGVDEMPCKARLVVDSYLGSMVAAEQGLGVALGVFPLTQSWVNAGRLSTPVPFWQKTRERHYFVVPRARDTDPSLRAVHRWVQERFDAMKGPR